MGAVLFYICVVSCAVRAASATESESSDYDDLAQHTDKEDVQPGYFTAAVNDPMIGMERLADTFVDTAGKLDHMVYCSETVVMSSKLLLEIFAKRVPSRMIDQSSISSLGRAVVDWKSDARSTASIYQQHPRQWLPVAPWKCARRSTWLVEKEEGFSGDSWQMTFPEGLFFQGSAKVTLVHRLGKSFYFSRSNGYLRWVQAITAVIDKSGAKVNVADLACGAGWLGSIIGTIVPAARIYFADANENVSAEVRRNVHANDLSTRTSYHFGDLFSAYHGAGMKGKFDHILFYAAQSDREKGAENQCIEGGICVMPHFAYFAPTETFFFERVLATYRQWLRPSGGTLWLGVDHHLVQQVFEMFKGEGDTSLRAVAYENCPATLVAVTVGALDNRHEL